MPAGSAMRWCESEQKQQDHYEHAWLAKTDGYDDRHAESRIEAGTVGGARCLSLLSPCTDTDRQYYRNMAIIGINDTLNGWHVGTSTVGKTSQTSDYPRDRNIPHSKVTDFSSLCGNRYRLTCTSAGGC